jgi:hypothetical protein
MGRRQRERSARREPSDASASSGRTDDDALAAVRRAFGDPKAPEQIWQTPFDYDPEHLHRLAQLQPNDEPAGIDLLDYALDIQYETVQRNLFSFVFPFCLRAWRDELKGHSPHYGAFVEHFYPALVDGRIFESVLTAPQCAAVSSFIRAAILEEIDRQHALTFAGSRAAPYRWIGALTTYGMILPDIERLWSRWWSVETRGRAIGAVQYISSLVFGEDENPVFAPWTPEAGGGPPCLWAFAGHMYRHRWMETNIAFLADVLTPAKVLCVLELAIAQLASQPEHEVAIRVLAGAANREQVLRMRCEELPRILREVPDPNAHREWSL